MDDLVLLLHWEAHTPYSGGVILPIRSAYGHLSTLEHKVHLLNQAFLFFLVVLVDTIRVDPKVFQPNALGNAKSVLHNLRYLFWEMESPFPLDTLRLFVRISSLRPNVAQSSISNF
jgi:hypothetical protein